MDNFDFLDTTNSAELTNGEEDPVARYFKIRQRIRQESFGSSRASSISLLSLNKTSFLGEPTATTREKNQGKLSLDEDIFKKPKTPTKPKKFGFDYLASTYSPVTPRFFQDELSSVTPDLTASLNTRSLVDFPLKDEGDILERLEKDEKKFVPNTSGFSHNSDITHFSEAKNSEQVSIGEFFAARCGIPELEDKNPKEDNQIIHDLLSDDELSGTVICEKLLSRNLTIGSKINLSDSRHSTPVARQNITTPLRRGLDWVPRARLDAQQEDTSQWRQLRQTFIEDDSLETTVLPEKKTSKSILEVVKKLKDIPAGKIDCSALAPLVKDEFPQLLGDFEQRVSTNWVLSSDEFRVPKDPLSVAVCVSAKQCVSVGIGSRGNWLLVRLSGVEVILGGQSLNAEKINETFVAGDWLYLKAKDVVLPPNTEHSIQLSVVCKKTISAGLRITLQARDIHNDKSVTNWFVMFLSVISPTNSFQITPMVDFGTIPENCSDDRTVKIVYSGECDVPLIITIAENLPFKFTNNVLLNGQVVDEVVWGEKSIELRLENGRQVLDLDVRFCPTDVPKIKEKRIVDFEGEISVDLKNTTGVNISKIRLHGSAAFARFLCRTDCSPFVFHATNPGMSITRQFFVKNEGAIPLKVGLSVTTDPSNSEEDDEFFTVPKIVAIPLNETVSFDITFHPRFGQNSVRRFLIMRLEPNDKTNYDVELIGTLSCSKTPSSRSSVKSLSSAVSGEGLAVKLSSTDHALSWMATPLQQSVLKTFQVKLRSEAGITARMSLLPGSFRIMNEKGEAMNKVRKILKPGIAVPITVQFKPDSVGLHVNQLAFEFNSQSEPTTVNLTGFGGCPKLRVEDTQLDLHGNRMVKLVHPQSDGFVYTAQFRITNYGNVSGFVLISPISNVLSVAHSLKVYPLQAVVEPNTNVIINLSQHLTRHEFRDILAKQDIRKMATLNVVMGDEPSRHRLRRYLSTKTDKKSEDNKKFVDEFPNEKKINLDGIKESKEFESIFLNSLSTCDIVAVVEKLGPTVDQTIVDLDESSCFFSTLSETVIVRQMGTKTCSEHSADTRRRKSPNSSYLSGNSQDTSRKVHDWLRKVV